MIYCVEDDKGILDLVIYTLKISGFEAMGFVSGEELQGALTDQTPDLILLDIMLPGDDGITILNRLKARPETADIPVIIASAKGTEYDKVIGLDLGADDYLAKPFGMMEMVARVKAVLRRSGKEIRETRTEKDALVNGDIRMLDADHLVYAGEETVQLTLKEYDLLRLFLRNPGRVFSRNQLLSKVWGIDYFGESRTVDVHIGTLRSKLGKNGSCIETVRGVGYKMEKQK